MGKTSEYVCSTNRFTAKVHNPGSESLIVDRSEDYFPHRRRSRQTRNRAHRIHNVMHRDQRSLSPGGGDVSGHVESVFCIEISEMQDMVGPPIAVQRLCDS